MHTNSQDIETDAAPSRPRTDEEIESSLSEPEEEEQEECSKEHTPKRKIKEETEFSNCSNSKSLPGDNTYVQTNNITISNSTGIHIGHNIFLNKNNKKNEEETNGHKASVPPPPPHIEKLFGKRKPAGQSDFIAIKCDIGPNWINVAAKLGLTASVIQQINDQYKHKGKNEVFYQLLLKWKESQLRTTATVGILCEALWSCNEINAASTLSKLHSDY